MAVLSSGRLEDTTMKKNKHMDLDARTTIETELGKGSSFKAIAELLGKDCTTVSKEVRAHLIYEKVGSYGTAFNDCANAYQHKCSRRHACPSCTARIKKLCWSCGKCTSSCPDYKKYICPKLAKPPYVCNGCPDRYKCSLEKAFYRAVYAQKDYKDLRSESRSGCSITETELSQLDSVVSPLLKKGQSVHHIALNHTDEVMVSERTLYKYINNGLFTARNLDMPRTVRMRPRRNKSKALKVDKKCRVNRTYDDYLAYMRDNPGQPVRELDSVEGIRGGAVLMTIQFVEQDFQLAFLRSANNSKSVTDIFNRLYLELGPDLFKKLFPVILTDNGSEFSNPKAMENDDQGNQRTKVFYCDANASYEKPHCENNHEMIRRCIPKGVDIGQYTQEQISLMMSHINSYERPILGNKSPYDVFAFQYGEDVLKILGLKRIPPDEIILSPKVFDQKSI